MNLPTASSPLTPPDPEYGEHCRYLAKVIINLLHPKLKAETEDEPQWRDWYFFWQRFFPDDFAHFAHFARVNNWPWAYVRKIVEHHIDCNLFWPCITYAELVSLYPCEVVSDDGILHEYCNKVLTDNPKSIVDYKKGKLNSLNHLKGQVMRLSKGKADIQKVELLLKSKMISL
jgi:Asp-tRNA(Asn)/Glu-tRNA(Gln) amidotransferase B subunit